MRVIHVTDYGSPHAGAFVPMLRTAMARIRACGWKPLATFPARARTRSREWLPEFEAEHGNEVLVAPDVSRRQLGRWLAEVVASDPGPTILHSHMTAYDLAVAGLARRRRDIRAIWHFHTVLNDDLRAQVRNRLRFALASRYVERMLCAGPGLVEAICARGAPRDKVLHFPAGLDVSRFPGGIEADERASARAALGVPSDAVALLHFSRDWQVKGGDLFLEAFRLLSDRDGLVALMLRGGDDARAEVTRHRLDDRALVLEDVSDIRLLYAASDLMMATSRGEGEPLAVLEALASGLGVVATDIPGHSAFIDGPPALSIAPLAPKGIAKTAAALLDRDPELARREGAISHEWVKTERGLEAWGDRLIALYEDVSRDWGAAAR
ncbi:MAG TPA: glycosyltransferase family 4 protein [Solirubrobacterales bacterium]|nr:glycosyltransferase family 4 protein [Solirubrobacterales bacterium]